MSQPWDRPGADGRPSSAPNQPYPSSPSGSGGGYTPPPAYGGYPPQAGYGAYPPGYPNPGYATPGYGPPGYGGGYPGGAPTPTRPGAALAAAVLSYIQAGFVLMGSFFVLAAGTALAEALVVGVLQLLTVGLLIFGAVQVTGGTGRRVMLIASGSQLVLVLYYLVRISTFDELDLNNGDGPWFVFPLFYAVLPGVAFGLTLTRPVTEWIAAKKRPAQGAAHSAAPGTAPWGR